MGTARLLVPQILILASLATTLAHADEAPDRFTEAIKDRRGGEQTFDMVLIPGGKFNMGSPLNEAGRVEHEGPRHEVEVKPFYICTTEVTFDLFMTYYEETRTVKKGSNTKEDIRRRAELARQAGVDAITGPTPLYGDPTLGWGGGQRPAMGISWHNAMTVCRWLSKKTGRKYRLPTEAEWEYACRAGTETAYFFGSDAGDLGSYAWFEANSEEMTQEVAKKKPNPWGLYDMLGNVREWVQDFYSPTAYAEKAPTEHSADAVHVVRGGAWDCEPEDLRCAARSYQEDWWQWDDPQEPKSIWWLPKVGIVGMRVVCEVEQ